MLKANNFSQLLPAHKVSGNIKIRTIKLNYGFYFRFMVRKHMGGWNRSRLCKFKI